MRRHDSPPFSDRRIDHGLQGLFEGSCVLVVYYLRTGNIPHDVREER
jgi:hypothetical protein